MISIGKQYTVFKPKEKTNSKGERIVTFSIGNSSYNKFTNSYDNKGFINVCAITKQLIYDRDRVSIKEITALDTSEFNGKPSITIFVKLEGEELIEDNYNSTDSNDLPF